MQFTRITSSHDSRLVECSYFLIMHISTYYAIQCFRTYLYELSNIISRIKYIFHARRIFKIITSVSMRPKFIKSFTVNSLI